MKPGIRSRRAAAAASHAIAAGSDAGAALSAPPSAAANGHEPPASPEPSNASGRPPAIVARRFSNGSAGTVRPPTFTPKLPTIFVSNGLVTIAPPDTHSGH